LTPDFKAKMHQILLRSPDPTAGFKGPTSKGGEEKGWERPEGELPASPLSYNPKYATDKHRGNK